jgi:hypothetical protein
MAIVFTPAATPTSMQSPNQLYSTKTHHQSWPPDNRGAARQFLSDRLKGKPRYSMSGFRHAGRALLQI